MTARVDPKLVREAWRRFGQLPADHKLIVDLFAGGGGASLGIEQALGRSPDIAINHDADAVAMHAANHPSTWHLVSDVWEVAPAAVTAGRTVGLLWASPDCKHFSKAKGGQPVKKRIRALAWIVVKWAREVAPEIILLENVEEFAGWGPLVQKRDALGALVFDLHGSPVMVPCRKRKGETFHRWRRQLERLGYRLEWRERRAFHSGAGTIRKRLYVIARRDGRPIVWPAATHEDPKKETGLAPWVTAADSIDWSLPCPSIFDTAEEIMRKHGVRAQRPLKPKTMARIAKGVWRYVIGSAEPFIVPVTHAGDIRVNPASEPLRTGTAAKRGEHAVVAPFVTKFRNGATGQPMPEPLATITAHTSETHPAGAAPLGVVAPYLVRTAHGDVDAGGHRRGRGDLPATDPAPTAMATNDAAIVAPYLVRTDMSSAFERNGVNTAEEPTRTFTSAGSHAVIAPVMVPRYGEREGQEPRARAVTVPAPVMVPDGNGGSLVAATMVRNFHGDTPEYPADTPARTTMTGRHDMLVAAHLNAYYGEGDGSQDRSAPADQPARTVPTENRHAVVSAFLAQHNYMEPGHDAGEPVSTIVGKGCTQAVVQAELEVSGGVVNLKGTGDDQLTPRPVEAPTPTATGQGQHIAEVRAFLMKYHGTGGQHASAARPMPTADCNDRIGIVTVHGVDYQIVDIGMRMLTPRERFRAQGFPDSYVIELMVPKTVGRKHKRVVMKPLSAEAQGRMVGNSVCPPEACALAGANCAHLAVSRERATA